MRKNLKIKMKMVHLVKLQNKKKINDNFKHFYQEVSKKTKFNTKILCKIHEKNL